MLGFLCHGFALNKHICIATKIIIKPFFEGPDVCNSRNYILTPYGKA